MPTAVLTSTPTVIDNAEATTNWNGDTFALEPDIKVQGNNSVACAQTATGNNDVWVSGLSFDASAVHIRLPFNISYIGDLSGTNPCQVFISDGTNTAYYDYDISSYAGGWEQAVVYTGNTPLSGTKPTGNTTEVGIRFVTISKPRNVPANAWYDAWTYGDGYTVTGGTLGDPINWSHIAALDLISAFNIVKEIEEVYFLAGEVTIGDGVATTYFEPSGQKLQFKDLNVLSTLYKVIFFDDASAVLNVDIKGGSWGAAAAQRWQLDASNVDINAFSMTGLQMSKGAAGTAFHAGATVKSNVFDDCLQITPSTSIFQLNTVTGYTGTGAAILAPASTTNFKDNIYSDNADVTNNPSAVEFDTVETYDLSGDSFSGNDFDILNSDNAATITAGSFVVDRGYKILTVGTTDYTLIGAADNNIGTKFVATGVGTGTGTATEVLVINKTNGANPSTASNTGTNADTLFVGSVLVEITVLDQETGLPIADTARVMIQKDSDKSEVSSGAVNASGVFSYSYPGATPLDIVGWVREQSLTGTDYVQKDFSGTITTNGFTLTVNLTPVT